MSKPYTIKKPSEDLKDFIHYFYYFENEDPFTFFSFPEVVCKFFFTYAGKFQIQLEDDIKEDIPTSTLRTMHVKKKLLKSTPNIGTFVVHLFPYTVPLCFPYKLQNIMDKYLDVKPFFASEYTFLDEKILKANSFEERIELFEDYLREKIFENKVECCPIFSTIKNLVKDKNIDLINSLANENNISERQFERNFKTYTGFTPKLFCRIVRFQNALIKFKNPTKTLTDIALECGYYDQAHFNNEFKKFTGVVPKKFSFETFLNK